MKIVLAAFYVLLAAFQVNGQDKPVADSSITAKNSAGPIKAYHALITENAKTKQGLFTVHQIKDKWYFEVPDSLIGAEFIAVTRYVRTPGGAAFYGGEMANQKTMYWEKGLADKLFLRVSMYVNFADSTQAIYKAVKNASLDPIVAAFDIKAYNKEHPASVIDVTDFFNGDNQVISLSPAFKKQNKLTTLAKDKSFITGIHTYPINTEVKTIKTFVSTAVPGRNVIPAAIETGVITLEMNTSFVLLPRQPMRKRFFDERVGFFADIYSEYSDTLQKVNNYPYIVRWRLEPKDEDIEKMKRGELVEPKKPIVYYIDPATPVKWRKYLIAGINDWQKAFEQAGFKNAIIGKEWPEGDSTMSLEDARFAVLRYYASPITNAYGPNVHDPRSGEIIESHIGWYHNVMQLVHDWYMVQAAAIDPRARKMEFDDELMGELIRFISSHEVGHTLGLRHNMGASSSTPVELLRNKQWLEENGHTASIMDYARFNYVAQPEDNISLAGIYPRIGVYDKWAIQWGYKPVFEAKNEWEEKKILSSLTDDSLSANPRLWFGGEGIIGDPRSQMEDLGDNAMKASIYGIKNLKRIISGLPAWTKEDGDQYQNLSKMYGAVRDQYIRYLYHVSKNIGGAYYTRKSVNQKGFVNNPVPAARVKEAVAFYADELFTTPTWLFPEYVVRNLAIRSIAAVRDIQQAMVKRLFSPALLLQVNEMAILSNSGYEVNEYLNDMERAIWKELNSGGATSIYRRNLQKIYVQQLNDILKPQPPKSTPLGFAIISPGTNFSDVNSVVRAHLQSLHKRIAQSIPAAKDELTRLHLQDVLQRIGHALEPPNN